MSTAQRDAYNAAWAAWSASMGDDMPDDLLPRYVRPAWNEKRGTTGTGRAESGPRRAPSGADDTVATVRALRAEAVDGLAVTLAIMGAAGLPVNTPAARRAYRWATTLDTVRASTVRMMGHDSVAPASRASEDRWVPTSVERLTDSTVRLWAEDGPVDPARGGRRSGAYRWAARHGWSIYGASVRQSARDAGSADDRTMRRAVDAMRTARAMLADSTIPADPPGRGRPAGWVQACAYLLATGRIDRADLPEWVARAKAPTAPEWEVAAAATD